MADEISKEIDFGEYRLTDDCFESLRFQFGGFDCDYFTSEWTYRCPVFFSRYWSPSTVGVDAFAQYWGAGFGFFHPPAVLIPKVIAKMIEDRARGVLIVPKWECAYWWPTLERAARAGFLKYLFYFSAVFDAPCFLRNTAFRGRPPFDMAAFVSLA